MRHYRERRVFREFCSPDAPATTWVGVALFVDPSFQIELKGTAVFDSSGAY